MNHFNHFVKEDATAGHTIGAIAVGGKANYIAGCGTNQGYNQTTSSYLKGPIIRVGADGCFIAKSLNLTGSESHMFPYHGPKIKNNNTTPEQPGDNTQGGNENPGENNPGTGPYLRKNVGQNRRNDHHPGYRHGTLHRPSRRNFCLRKRLFPG